VNSLWVDRRSGSDLVLPMFRRTPFVASRTSGQYRLGCPLQKTVKGAPAGIPSFRTQFATSGGRSLWSCRNASIPGVSQIADALRQGGSTFDIRRFLPGCGKRNPVNLPDRQTPPRYRA
jgi:hypothetical protein